MIGKAALAFSAPLLLSAVPDAPVYVSHAYVHRMVCAEGRGTAFQVNDNTALTVSHVASMTDCRIDGIPVEMVENDPDSDFAILRYRFSRHGGLRLSCEGFRDGEAYFAIGHAKGLPVQQVLSAQFWLALPDLPFSQLETLYSPTPFIPGMSGGPVFNSRGAVVGTVNAYNPYAPLSFSLPLSETSVCGK
jgi:S1-C subfamily serine protease